MESFKALILADVVPGILNIGDGSLINGGHIRLNKSVEHLSIDSLAIHHLWFDSIDYFSPKLHDLVDKIGSELI